MHARLRTTLRNLVRQVFQTFTKAPRTIPERNESMHTTVEESGPVNVAVPKASFSILITILI